MNLSRLSIAKQLLGGAVGAVMALAAYQGYRWISPAITALWPESGTAAEQYTDESRTATQDAIAARAREILQDILAEDASAEGE